VALETTFRDLWARLNDLIGVMNEFHVSVGFTPPHEETAVADDLGEASLHLIGILHESLGPVGQARQAVTNDPDLNRARKTLAICQEHFNRFEKDFPALLSSYKQLTELARLANERPEWTHWAANMKQGIEDCREPMAAVRVAVAACWQELAERVGMNSVSVHNTSVGQRIVAKPSEGNDVRYERVT
jgi:hypothetical protein